jgi:ATP-binding cassette subfamily F protein 3
LLVSHDRYLVDALATQIWEIQPDESTLSIFKGTYSQMREENERLASLVSQNDAFTRQAETVRKSTSGNNSAAREERRHLARLQELENTISSLETRLAEISRKLENRFIDSAEVMKLGNEYQSVQNEMDKKLSEWEIMQK